ncbi:MAG: glycosyltransferase [Planctomycetota bacterium]|jgi:UDP:flavonoid glycosyltransferase YjiC (YdhE family)
MSHILLSTFGTSGDTRPFESLALALKRAGYEPVLLVNPNVQPRFTAKGLHTYPVGDSIDVNQLIRDNPHFMSVRGGEHVLKEVYIPYSRTFYNTTSQAIEEFKPVAMVSHIACFGAIWAARQKDLLVVGIHMAPTTMLNHESVNAYSAPIRLLSRLLIPCAIKMANHWIRTTCKELGVPWQKNTFKHTMNQHDLFLGLWSPTFADFSSFNGHDKVLCGFTFLESPKDALPQELVSFLHQGDPPIAFALGSSAVNVAGDFYRTAIQICQSMNKRALLIGAAPGTMDITCSNIYAIPHIDYARILGQCSAFVHHGGIGTTAEGLRAGIPAIVMPFGHDQFDNAQRLKALGIGRKVSRKKLAQQLAPAIEAMLSPRIVERARRLGLQVKQEPDGAEIATKAIQRTV